MQVQSLVGWVLVVGALNLGLLGLLGLNLVESALGGAGSLLVRAVYVVVGLAGAYKLYVMVAGKK